MFCSAELSKHKHDSLPYGYFYVSLLPVHRLYSSFGIMIYTST